MRKEAATIMAVFPSPNDVMSILVHVSHGSLLISSDPDLCDKICLQMAA